MTVALPDDILHLLCAELSDQGEFDTLFACALSSKRLAVPALTALYRYGTCQHIKVHDLQMLGRNMTPLSKEEAVKGLIRQNVAT